MILRRFNIVAAFCAGVVTASLITIAFNHLIFIQWFESLKENNLLAYNGVSLLIVIRLLFVELGYTQLSSIIGLGLPILLAGIVALVGYKRRNQELLVTCDQVVILLFGSIIFAPYLWVHDMSILTLANLSIVQIACFELRADNRGVLIMSILILNSLLSTYLGYLGIYDYRLFYYPIIVLAVWIYSKYLLKNKVRASQLCSNLP